jgi:hypothetical protein
MTREELQAVIEVVLGIHNTTGRVSTILAAADAYAKESYGQGRDDEANAEPISGDLKRDPASTTTTGTERRWSPQAHVPASPFGFGQ